MWYLVVGVLKLVHELLHHHEFIMFTSVLTSTAYGTRKES